MLAHEPRQLRLTGYPNVRLTPSAQGEYMDLSILLTIGFGIISVIAFLYAINESKKAKKAEQRIIEIEHAVVSYKYLKEKAFEYYDTSRYDESLDVFRRGCSR